MNQPQLAFFFSVKEQEPEIILIPKQLNLKNPSDLHIQGRCGLSVFSCT